MERGTNMKMNGKVKKLMRMIDETADLVEHVQALIAEQPDEIREFLETSFETKLFGEDPYETPPQSAWN